MSINFRQYNHTEDYTRVSNFLIDHYLPGNAHDFLGAPNRGNWLEPMWEYMHFHPAIDAANLGRFRIWEVSGEMIAVCHYEWHLGEAFFQFHPAYSYLREEMLNYAEQELTGISPKDGRRYLCAYINDNDPEFLALAQARGYKKDDEETRPLYQFTIPNPFPGISLPEGFRLTSLAEECNWGKVNQVLWRGFDHGDDVPMNEEEFESRRKMFDTPKARRDLKIAVAAPNGEFASFCGMFYEPNGRFGYVEPVATDPRYRRLGLGKSAVLEGIRRCEALGATVAYVGSNQLFYQAIGFTKVFNSECWVKYFE